MLFSFSYKRATCVGGKLRKVRLCVRYSGIWGLMLCAASVRPSWELREARQSWGLRDGGPASVQCRTVLYSVLWSAHPSNSKTSSGQLLYFLLYKSLKFKFLFQLSISLLKLSFKILKDCMMFWLIRDIPVFSVRRMWPGWELPPPGPIPARTSPGQASKAKMAATQLLCASTRYADF